MARFQTVLGIVLLISAVVIIILSAYNLTIINKATIDTQDPKTRLTDMEKKGVMATNAILIIIGVILGVYGIVILMPARTPGPTEVVVSQRTARAVI